MGLNYPECEWIFSDSYLAIFSHSFNVTVEEAEMILTDSLGPCAPLAFNDLPSSYVTILTVLYSVVMTIGILGNACVIAVVISCRKLWKPINFLLLSLASSDLLLSLTLPWTIIRNTSYDYTMGPGLCKAIPPIQGTAVLSSISVLLIIALERHQAIVYPTRQNTFRSKRKLRLAIFLVWICSFCFQIPQIVVLDDVTWQETTSVVTLSIWYKVTVHVCRETWSAQQSQDYSIAIVVIVYAVPVALLAFLYGRIGYFLRSRRGIESSLSAESSERSRSRRRRLSLMLVLLVASFALFWGPYFIFQCLTVCITSYCSPELVGYLQLLGHVNVALDPVLYAVLHERVREEFVAMLKKLGKAICGCKTSTLSRIPRRSRSENSPQLNRDFRNANTSSLRPVYTVSVTSPTDNVESTMLARPSTSRADSNFQQTELYELQLPGTTQDP